MAADLYSQKDKTSAMTSTAAYRLRQELSNLSLDRGGGGAALLSAFGAP
jgi:hypothetical protein